MLRRVLWLVPTLFLVSIAAFQFLIWTLPRPAASAPHELPGLSLPSFFNHAPQGARELALQLMSAVARGGARGERAAQKLSSLGGAALPHVLPKLDELRPAERARVSLALAPVARRMGIGNDERLIDPESASLFWTRFWQDREFDFRPVVVRRLVKRLTERSLALRRDDVIQLDTYALPELMRALGSVNDRADIERVRRLTGLMSHIAEKDWQLESGASREQARRLVRDWRTWWLDHGQSYVALEGPAKATAMLTQTRYGKWLRSMRFGLGTRSDGSSVLSALVANSAGTLLLLACGLFGGTLLGAALAVGSVLSGGRRLGRAATLGALLVAALPLAVVCTALASGDATPSRWAGCALMVLVGFGLGFLYQRAATLARRWSPWWPCAATPWSLGAVLRASSATALALLVTGLPGMLLSVAIVEAAFELPGLGVLTVQAVRQADLAWLMAMALLGATGAGLLQIIGDAVTERSVPRRVVTSAAQLLPRSG